MATKKDAKKFEDIDFEIRFIESLLKERPNFVAALTVLGDHYTKKGLYERGLEIDKKLARLKPFDALIRYNLACSYSLVNDIDKSLEAVKSAVEYGYRDFQYLETDSDLSNLRQDARFQKFLTNIKEARKHTSNKP